MISSGEKLLFLAHHTFNMNQHYDMAIKKY